MSVEKKVIHYERLVQIFKFFSDEKLGELSFKDAKHLMDCKRKSAKLTTNIVKELVFEESKLPTDNVTYNIIIKSKDASIHYEEGLARIEVITFLKYQRKLGVDKLNYSHPNLKELLTCAEKSGAPVSLLEKELQKFGLSQSQTLYASNPNWQMLSGQVEIETNYGNLTRFSQMLDLSASIKQNSKNVEISLRFIPLEDAILEKPNETAEERAKKMAMYMRRHP